MNHKASRCEHVLYKHLPSYFWYLGVTIDGDNEHYKVFIQQKQITVVELGIDYLPIDSVFEYCICLTDGLQIFNCLSADCLKVISFFLLDH